MHAEQDPRHADARVEPLRHQMHGLQQLLQAAQRKVVRLHGHEDLVRHGERIHTQHAQARGAVEKHHVVLGERRLQLQAERMLHVRALRQFPFHQRELCHRRNEVEPGASLKRHVLHSHGWIHEQLVHAWLIIARLNAKVQGEIRLRIQIHQQHSLAVAREGRSQIDGGGGLANAPLLVQQRHDARPRRWRNHGTGKRTLIRLLGWKLIRLLRWKLIEMLRTLRR